MPSSSNILVTVDTKDAPGWMTPIPFGDDNVTRDKTVFHVISEDNGMSFMGTFDEILNYVAQLMGVVYSWPVIAGRDDWFTEQDKAILERAGKDGSGSGNPGSGSQDGGSSTGEEWAWQ